jgi:OOP family OmpA-OmpF porin
MRRACSTAIGPNRLAVTVGISPLLRAVPRTNVKSDAIYESSMTMIHSMTKKQLSLAVSCALALGAAFGTARAETNPASTGYLTDQRDAVAKSGYGLCWHSGFGPAPVSTAECDPNFVPAPSAAVVEPTPQPVAATVAEPIAVAVEAPEAAVLVRMALDADTLFDFDKSELRPAGRLALDDFVTKIKGIDPELIMAVGFTDRLGSEAYNQRLSEQRVLAVKTYLVSKGIEPNRVHTEGRGKAEPITKTGECAGVESAQVIACLQPDRRVEIEVRGTQIAM